MFDPAFVEGRSETLVVAADEPSMAVSVAKVMSKRVVGDIDGCWLVAVSTSCLSVI